VMWTEESFALVRVGELGNGIYIVDLKALPSTGIHAGGPVDILSVLVLLDGTSVLPKLN